MKQIADDLASKSWAVCSEFLPSTICSELAGEVRSLRQAAKMHAAGVGRGTELQVARSIRSDAIFWLDEQNLSSAQKFAFDQLELLRIVLNRELYLGLRELEAHLTYYPPNGHYTKHVDNFRGESKRILSCIIYLNPAWSDTDGGGLKIFSPVNEDFLVAEIPPRSGTLACFLSRDIPHEVATTTKERLSLTGWFRQ